ncbi:MAG: hypothetical protein WD229_08305, partial [Pirellulales bacterium]
DAWSADELIRQVEATRAQPGATGNVHFSMKALMQNYDGIADKLKNDLYAEPALVPESKWLGRGTPPKPEAAARRNGSDLIVEMKLPHDKTPWQWLVRVRMRAGWKSAIIAGREKQHSVALENDDHPQAVTVSAVTRLGRIGPAASVEIEDRE